MSEVPTAYFTGVEKAIKQLEQVNHHKNNTVSVVVDSGTTSHFMQSTDNLLYAGLSQKIVHLPDGSTIKASHLIHLPFNTIKDSAWEAHMLPDLKGNSLLSIPVLAM